MDFDDLEKEGVISRPTRDWLEPMWQQEEKDARAAQDERADAPPRLFGNNDSDDEDEDEDDDSTEERSIVLNGVRISYLCDDQSAGHGNKVWHASIALCLYLSTRSMTTLVVGSGDDKNSSKINTASPFQSLELGSGTAIPSLYLAQTIAASLANKSTTTQSCSSMGDGDTATSNKPLVHITDGRQYRNIRQILQSVSLLRQSSLHDDDDVRQRVNVRVSPHNWGQEIGIDGHDSSSSFFSQECLQTSPTNQYDLVIVSDCIYNPMYHEALLDSIASTLKFPTGTTKTTNTANNGGRAIVSFSLHGNTKDETVWNFLDMVNHKCSTGGKWKLQALPITDLDTTDNALVVKMEESVDNRRSGGGWNMEKKMRQLDLWVANLEPSRWIAYLYELTWIPTTVTTTTSTSPSS
jgi:predicted nicotinamide N-methyase